MVQSKNFMYIALLGGSFDPPHNGHLFIARSLLQANLPIDEIWLLPTYAHHWKSMYASAENRLAMTRLLDEGKIKTSDIDVRLGFRYAIETVTYLQKHTNNTYIWICGADTINDFHRWKQYKELQKKIKFLVVPRNNVEIESLPNNFSTLLKKDFPSLPYSSSEIRDRIKKGLSIDTMVPKKVKDYIFEKKLYK